jgi:signal peptidase II
VTRRHPSGLSRALRALARPLAAVVLAAIRSRIALSAVLVFGADRLSKFWVVEIMDLGHLLKIEVAPPFLTFVMAWNTGINFGILSGSPGAMRWILILVALAISAALVWWVRRRAGKPGAAPLELGAGIVIGGALGNAWDRLQYGAVADFLNMSCCGIDNPYAFNIADVAIFAGAALIALKA